LYIAYEGINIQGSPFNSVHWVNGPVTAAYTRATGFGVESNATIVAGDDTSFDIISYNPYGLQIPTCPDHSLWSIVITPNISAYPPNLDIFAGPCFFGVTTVTYNATTEGSYEVNIYLNATAIYQSPYNISVFPTTIDASKTIITGLTSGSDNGTFFLQARDKYGNNETRVGPNTFEVSLSPACANWTIHTMAVGGRIQCTYEVVEGGIYCVNIDYGGSAIAISGSEFYAVGGTGCSDLGHCNYQGFCFKDPPDPSTPDTYSCNCNQEYVGPDCSTKFSRYPMQVGAIVGLVIGLAALMFIVGLVLGFVIFKYAKRSSDSDHAPLLGE